MKAVYGHHYRAIRRSPRLVTFACKGSGVRVPSYLHHPDLSAELYGLWDDNGLALSRRRAARQPVATWPGSRFVRSARLPKFGSIRKPH